MWKPMTRLQREAWEDPFDNDAEMRVPGVITSGNYAAGLSMNK